MTPLTSFVSSLIFLISSERLPSTSTRSLISNSFPTTLFMNPSFMILLSHTCLRLHRHRMNLREVEVLEQL